jgi:hypothetical protein
MRRYRTIHIQADDHVITAVDPEVGWPGGISPPGSHRSRRDSLPAMPSSA